MTESQVLNLAWRLGPWAGLIIALAYIVANRVGPVWLADWREKRQADRAAGDAERAATTVLYERLVAQNTEMIKFIASATEAIHTFARSLDANTQQIYHLTQSVERGPRCPLPDCPFMSKKDIASETEN